MKLTLFLDHAKDEIETDADTLQPNLTKDSNATERSSPSLFPEKAEEVIFSKTFLHSDLHYELGQVVFQMLLDYSEIGPHPRKS